MTVGGREGLIARIRGWIGIKPLEARIAHLERLVEGLQDSVHRESERHERLIAELQAQIKPDAMGAALAKDARRRGL